MIGKDKNVLFEILKRINALATNPHWTADRRWRIAELAEEGMRAIQKVIPDPHSPYFFSPGERIEYHLSGEAWELGVVMNVTMKRVVIMLDRFPNTGTRAVMPGSIRKVPHENQTQTEILDGSPIHGQGPYEG